MTRYRKERIRVRRHRVRRHRSHSRSGRAEEVRGYVASGSVQERSEPYPHGRRLGITMKHHPGYSASKSAEANARLGYRAAKDHHIMMPWLHAEKELTYIGLLNKRTNPEASRRFFAAAGYARKEHEKAECRFGRCPHRHSIKRHRRGEKRVWIPAHASHSYEGRKEHVRGHYIYR